MRISSECARSARSSSVSCQTRPSGDTLAAATGALTRLGFLATGGANQPGPSSVSSVTAASCTMRQPSCARARGSAPAERSLRSWAVVCAHSFAAAATLTSTRISRRLLYVPAFQLVGASGPNVSPPRRWYSQACSAAPLSRVPTKLPKCLPHVWKLPLLTSNAASA